jgi:hypothetical protein
VVNLLRRELAPKQKIERCIDDVIGSACSRLGRDRSRSSNASLPATGFLLFFFVTGAVGVIGLVALVVLLRLAL